MSDETSNAGIPRSYLVLAVVLAVLVLGVVSLFGWLISQSMSRRYLDEILLAGSEEARAAADALVGGDPERFDVTEVRKEDWLRTGIELGKRRLYERIVVTDAEGRIVYQAEISSEEILPDLPESDLDRLLDSNQEPRSYQITAPIGGVGAVVLDVSTGELASRVGRLQDELRRMTLLVSGITLLVLFGVYAFAFHLLRRNRRLEQRRRHSEELASLGTLAANLAHEIRNPLNSINLNLEMLEEDVETGSIDQSAEALTATRTEVARLGRLVTDFLTYARPSVPKRSQIDLHVLVAETVQFLRPEAARHGVHLRLVPDSRKVEVAVDAAQLRQVVINLVQNAVLAVTQLQAERQLVEIEVKGASSSASISIRDRGPGIPEDQIAEIRKAFVTTRQGGSGLGLAIAERIAESHGGRLELRNIENGFEAALVLPRRAEGGNMRRPAAKAE